MKRLILFLIAVFALTGCATPAVTSYIYDPPRTPGGRMCSLQCDQAHGYCSQGCGLRSRQCVQNAQRQALHDYDNYVTERFNAHQPVELFASDFERRQPCDTIKNDCESDCQNSYRMCYEDCGGKVEELTSCQFLCF